MGPSPKLSSLLQSSSTAAGEASADVGGVAGVDASCSPPVSRHAEMEPSTERVERALGLAFDRLWRDRPTANAAEAVSDHDAADGEDDRLLGTVDSYISNYFRHVAELSRESVYQSHQRAILCRMREDVVAGDRSGNMRDLEERIQKAELNDRSLQAEIASRMKIVDREQGAV